MLPTTFMSARLMTTEIIAKYLTLTPMVVAKFVNVGRDAAEANMVVGTDKSGVTGAEGLQNQPDVNA